MIDPSLPDFDPELAEEIISETLEAKKSEFEKVLDSLLYIQLQRSKEGFGDMLREGNLICQKSTLHSLSIFNFLLCW